MSWAEQRHNGRWKGVYRDAQGRKRSAGTFPHKPKAERAAAKAEDKARRRIMVDPSGPRMYWAEWADTWWPSRATQDSTHRADTSRFETHVRPRWRSVRLGEMQTVDIQEWVNELGRSRSASTVRQCFYLLASSLRSAQVHGLIDFDPCKGVTLPPLPVGKERYLSRQEVDRVLFQLHGPHRMLAELLVGTGMRISEACALHIDRAQIAERRIDVVHVYDHQNHVMRPYPKGRKRRSVPISDHLAQRLDDWLSAHPPSAECGYKHEGDQCRGGLVLTGQRGSAIDPHNFTQRTWSRAVKDAQIGHARPHDLRHTYASWLIQEGVTLERISKLLGHASITTTERYAHLMDDGHEEVRGALHDGRSAANTARSASGGQGADVGAARLSLVVNNGSKREGNNAQ
ncbi:Site-specific recombinase XerD [Haloechinothrix alba]|uniref:Site-specific recombinase XerD n=1 Tax=Haloechinothrix alba TaxID=664784 RepID=A0A238WDM6_9PSEU|nr:tyrosine-type recombinase/integrase [Haloechinothrix alba]SNR44682.1 Site-specific recombinase XerD [Haloechinothrix alba]